MGSRLHRQKNQKTEATIQLGSDKKSNKQEVVGPGDKGQLPKAWAKKKRHRMTLGVCCNCSKWTERP